MMVSGPVHQLPPAQGSGAVLQLPRVGNKVPAFDMVPGTGAALSTPSWCFPHRVGARVCCWELGEVCLARAMAPGHGDGPCQLGASSTLGGISTRQTLLTSPKPFLSREEFYSACNLSFCLQSVMNMKTILKEPIKPRASAPRTHGTNGTGVKLLCPFCSGDTGSSLERAPAQGHCMTAGQGSQGFQNTSRAQIASQHLWDGCFLFLQFRTSRNR